MSHSRFIAKALRASIAGCLALCPTVLHAQAVQQACPAEWSPQLINGPANPLAANGSTNGQNSPAYINPNGTINAQNVNKAIIKLFKKNKPPAPSNTSPACDPNAQNFDQSNGPAPAGKQWPVAPGLFVAIPEDYPEGPYKPVWPSVQIGQDVRFTVQDHVAGNYSSNTSQSLKVAIGELGGRPVLAFNTGMRQCAADILNVPLVLGLTPRPIRLGPIHDTGPQGGPCGSGMDSYAAGWSGRLSLSATPTGSLMANLDLRILSNRGAVSYDYSAPGVEFANSVSPTMARAQIVKDAQMAELARIDAERTRLRSDQRARNGGVVDSDIEMPVVAMQNVHHLNVITRNIRDFGTFVIIHPDGTMESAAMSESKLMVGLGAADDVLDSHLKTGRNTVIFVLHHKPFIVLGGGSWSFQAELLGDNKTIWGAQGNGTNDPSGIQFWKAFTVIKRPNGTFAVSAPSAIQRTQVLPQVVKFNNFLIAETTRDQNQKIGNFLVNMFNDRPSSHSSSVDQHEQDNMDYNRHLDKERQNAQDRATEREREPPPTPPIAPLYGTPQ